MRAPAEARLIKLELDALTANLIERGLCDDSNFSALRQSGGVWEVTFNGAEYVSIGLGDIDYGELYGELEAKRSYNVKLIDGGLIQLMYAFRQERLLQHRLAFFPSPTLRQFQEDADAYLRDELFLEIVSRRIVPFPLRFDFDDRDGVHVEVRHPRSHLTLGDAKCCRVPVTSGVTPRWFFEFVIRNFYQTESHDFVSALPGHKLQLPLSITARESTLMHLAVPRVG